MEQNENLDLDEYRQVIRDRLASASPEFVENSNSEHASVILEEMIKSARVSFHAYARSMNDTVWNGRVIRALEMALHRGVTVRIVVSDRCVPLDKGAMPNALKSCVMKSGCADEVKATINHFAVADGRSLRWETDPCLRTAEFSADAGILSRTAERVFLELYAGGRPCDGLAA